MRVLHGPCRAAARVAQAAGGTRAGRAHFSRVVIETRGDLGPILRTFATERALGDDFYVEEEPEAVGELEPNSCSRETPRSPGMHSAASSRHSRRCAARTCCAPKGCSMSPGCRGPVVVRYRQHLALPPVELVAWPDDDRRSRIAFVARNCPREVPTVAELLASRPTQLSSAPRIGSGEIRPAVHVDGLPGDVARAGAAQEAHHRGDIVRCAALAGQRVVDQVMRRLRRIAAARGVDRARRDQIDRDVIAARGRGRGRA